MFRQREKERIIKLMSVIRRQCHGTKGVDIKSLDTADKDDHQFRISLRSIHEICRCSPRSPSRSRVAEARWKTSSSVIDDHYQRLSSLLVRILHCE